MDSTEILLNRIYLMKLLDFFNETTVKDESGHKTGKCGSLIVLIRACNDFIVAI